MKRRAAYFLLCVCFCFSTLSLSSSAVEYDPYTGEEMLYDPDKDIYYSPYKPLEYEPIMPLITTEPAYPDFDVNKLPWLEMPTYVQEILYGEPQGNVTNVDYDGTYKLPFVLVLVQSSTIHVVAGWNLFIGSYFATEVDNVTNKKASTVFVSAYKDSPYVFQHSVCYHARYKRSDYSLYLNWTSVDPIAVGDRLVRYYGLPYPDGGTYDCYLYGFNAVKPGAVLVNIPIYESANYPLCRITSNPVSGFTSGSYVLFPDNFNNYFTSFTPPTPEQQQANTQKGIWETLKSIPDMIGDKIKSLFIPSDGFFDAYVDEFQDYFKDRFGLLYEVPEIVIEIFYYLLDYSPAESGYSIMFPEVVMPVLDNGEWYDVTIIEETEITFDFLELEVFNDLYTFYCSLLWMIFIFALFNLIIRKSERIFGGLN